MKLSILVAHGQRLLKEFGDMPVYMYDSALGHMPLNSSMHAPEHSGFPNHAHLTVSSAKRGDAALMEKMRHGKAGDTLARLQERSR